MQDSIVYDGPEDRCFGCGQRNESGLKLRFRRTSAASVEAEYEAPEALAGSPGVVHGGIQAVLLDEVMGVTAQLDARDGATEAARIVTVDFRLRYRRPTPTGTALTIRGRLDRVEGSDYYLEGEILDPDGEVLTRAEARWRRLPGQAALRTSRPPAGA